MIAWPDMLDARTREGDLQKPAVERYSKHVKTLIQVGTTPSNHYATVMGYPAELVPVENPYDLKAGGTLHVKTLVDGKPAANQFVLFGGQTASNGVSEQKSTRSGADGIAANGGRVVHKVMLATRQKPQPNEKRSKFAPEAFGFADGMSQPVIRGTKRHPAIFADTGPADGGGPTVLVYGHYDVQPTGDEKL